MLSNLVHFCTSESFILIDKLLLEVCFNDFYIILVISVFQIIFI